MPQTITVTTSIDTPLEKIWKYWTEPEHIKNWYFASDDWHVPQVTNNISVGGTFVIRMESRDGKEGFDFTGVYTEVIPYEKLVYTIEGGRKVVVQFTNGGYTSTVTEIFEIENINSPQMQQQGWQAILDNFEKYVLEK
jgi:uncharacterized protein YndB with AHSA1/START domain